MAEGGRKGSTWDREQKTNKLKPDVNREGREPKQSFKAIVSGESLSIMLFLLDRRWTLRADNSPAAYSGVVFDTWEPIAQWKPKG